MSLPADLRTLAVHRDFGRLLRVRLVSQAGDGLFQVGLASVFFFSPERMTTAADVATAFAVLLLPFTVVGPFAGPLLDRWRRRQVLLIGNAVRVLLTLALAWLMVAVGVGPAVYLLTLVTLGVNRFLLAALSAGLPRVVPADQLLLANSITPTLGALAAVGGAAAGFGVGRLLPVALDGRDGVVLTLAALVFAAASAAAQRIDRDRLGPQGRAAEPDALRAVRTALATTTRDLADGARYLMARSTPAGALAVMALHRLLYGASFIALVLVSRNLLADPADPAAGLAVFGTLTAVSFAGNGLAVVLTPIAHQRLEPATWVGVCLGVGAASQLVLATSSRFGVVALAAALLGLGVQGAKIAVDTIVQRDTADVFRGRAFALYDVLYNAAFVGAAALAAAVLPDTGWSRPVAIALAAAYLAGAAAYRRVPIAPRPQPSP